MDLQSWISVSPLLNKTSEKYLLRLIAFSRNIEIIARFKFFSLVVRYSKYIIPSFFLSLFVFFYIFLAFHREVDSDASSVVLQAFDMLHGNWNLQHWKTTFNSYWLLYVIWYTPLIALMGLKGEVVPIMTGLVFVALLSASMLLASQQYLKPRHFFLVICVIFFSYNMSQEFLSLSFGHYHFLTMVYGLISLLIIKNIIETNIINLNFLLKGIVTIILLAFAMVSDPFIYFAFIMPIAVAVMYMVGKEFFYEKKFAKLPQLGYVVILLTMAFILHCLILMLLHLKNGYIIEDHATTRFIALKNLPQSLLSVCEKIMTLANANFFSKSIFSLETIITLAHLIFFLFMLYCIVRALRRQFHAPDIVILAALLGILGDVLLFAFTTRDGMPPRYFIPVIIFGAIVTGIESTYIIKKISFFQKIVFNTFIFVIGILLSIHTWISILSIPLNTQRSDLIQFLLSHHLNYGLGTFWNASSLTVTSHHKITTLPLMLDNNKFYNNNGLANFEWYKDKDHEYKFVVWTDEDYSPSNRISFLQLLTQQFGKPNEIIEINCFHIAIWNQDILHRLKFMP